MKRRAFLESVALCAAMPATIHAKSSMRTVAALIPYDQADVEARAELAAFLEELARLGWRKDASVRIDLEWGAVETDRIAAAARRLLAGKPDVILARTTPVTAALRVQTRSVPIVFVVVSDPVGAGLVESLSHPGGNVTGFTNVESSFGSKWLELLKEVKPALTRVGAVFSPKTSPSGGSFYLTRVQMAAAALDLSIVPLPAEEANEMESAISQFARQANGALVVFPDINNLRHRSVITAVAARHRLPAIYPWRAAPETGGLMSYGVEYTDLYRRAASYVDRILRGAKPADLPVQAPTKFDLVVNTKVARELGVTIPGSVLLLANKLIE